MREKSFQKDKKTLLMDLLSLDSYMYLLSTMTLCSYSNDVIGYKPRMELSV